MKRREARVTAERTIGSRITSSSLWSLLAWRRILWDFGITQFRLDEVVEVDRVLGSSYGLLVGDQVLKSSDKTPLA
jgi:hypothetical protein